MRESAEISAPAGHGRVGFVAARDVAAVAAQVLTSPGGHEGATYVLTGPEALRFKDVAARISTVFAREVGYTDQPAERARERMLASGLTRWLVDGNLELFDWIRQGGADTVTDTVREVTGADPQPAADWLEESRADFEVPPLDLPRSFFGGDGPGPEEV
jgi:NAD(P)H dehydrogenase (quinone)